MQAAQGKTLSNKLVRAGRSMNAGVYFVTQNAQDLTDEYWCEVCLSFQ
ncbi:hypothetical protein CHCC20347_0717 [Bacillus paralicheniformis]|nr:hypothetical protein CHCC20347_0717 [Bacillus paralicheniformis]